MPVTPPADATLTLGQVYDPAARTLLGWTAGDGSSTEGYAVEHYFDPAGRYLGPDRHGIEPLFCPEEPAPLTSPYRLGDRVQYQGKAYRVTSVTLHGVAGPHYRLAACGDYPGEDLTSAALLSRLAEGI